MVTRSKKPAADATAKKAPTKPAAPKKAAAKPRAAAKKATPSKTVAPSRTATPKAVVAETTEVVAIPDVGRAIGEMIYNDELFEAMAEIILMGSGKVGPELMPAVKKQLFDFDIYMVSFLTDEDLGNIAKALKVPEPLLRTVRDNAKIFVDIAGKHHSVRAFIDKMIEAEGKTHGINRLKLVFTDEMKAPEPHHYEKFLLLF